MTSQIKPRWLVLALIGFVFAAALVEEARLPFSPAADAWLVGIGVLLFYGTVAMWVSRNREALEREPPPLDLVGRPIFDSGASEFEAIPESRGPRSYNASGALNQSEAI
jgi:hypothetical protein